MSDDSPAPPDPYAPPLAALGPARPPRVPGSVHTGALFVPLFGWIGFDLGRTLVQLALSSVRLARGGPFPSPDPWGERLALACGVALAMVAMGGIAWYSFGRRHGDRPDSPPAA